jgi:hypothetical protein
MAHISKYSPPYPPSLPRDLSPSVIGNPEHPELTARDVSTSEPVNYRQVDYEPPPQEFKFDKVVRNADVPKQPEPPPPSENRAICSGLAVKVSCMIGSVLAIPVGFGLIFGIESTTAAIAAGCSMFGVAALAISAGLVWPHR